MYILLFLVSTFISSLAQNSTFVNCDSTSGSTNLLEGKFLLSWQTDCDFQVIHFALAVNSTSWIGIGFNNKDSMESADIVMAFYDGGSIIH